MRQVEIEDPFTGEFEQPSLRTLVLTSSQDMSGVVEPLQQWAGEHGYKFRASSPTGQPGSVLFQLWNGTIVILAGNRLGNGGSRLSGLNVTMYWNGDTADEAALNGVAKQISDVLARFGTVEMTSAPPGTSPRRPSTNTWRRH